VWCSELKYAAECCSELQCVATKKMEPLQLLRVAVWGSEVQYVAVCFSVLQCVATEKMDRLQVRLTLAQDQHLHFKNLAAR